MSDKEFLEWIRDRIVHVYGESPNTDFVLRLGDIAQALQHSGEPVGEVFEVLCEGRIVYAEVYDGAVIPHKAKLYTTPQPVVPEGLTLWDLDIIRQWHNAAKDGYGNYLDERDADTFAKLEALLSAGKGGEQL
jgi:hypothetical protein